MLKTTLITGATDGIEMHLAQKMANEGHEVIIHGRNPEKLRKVLSDIQLKSGNQQVHAYLADFTKMSDVYHFAHEIESDFQKIDVLFNNAGLYAGSQRQVTPEDLERPIAPELLDKVKIDRYSDPCAENVLKVAREG